MLRRTPKAVRIVASILGILLLIRGGVNLLENWEPGSAQVQAVLLLNNYDRFGPVTKGLENLPNGVKEAIVTNAFATRPVIASTGANVACRAS
jgi:hypothetical protein